jgi:hypothetical protein
VEMDCLTLIKDLEKGSVPHSRMAGLLTEIRAVGILLPNCKFRHINRGGGGNEVAHSLAQRAIKHQECVRDQIDLESVAVVVDPPDCNQLVS